MEVKQATGKMIRVNSSASKDIIQKILNSPSKEV